MKGMGLSLRVCEGGPDCSGVRISAWGRTWQRGHTIHTQESGQSTNLEEEVEGDRGRCQRLVVGVCPREKGIGIGLIVSVEGTVRSGANQCAGVRKVT
jgi:hypothetical protein